MSWKYTIISPSCARDQAEDILQEMCHTTCSFENDPEGKTWCVEGYCEQEPALTDLQQIDTKLALIEGLHASTQPFKFKPVTYSKVPETNWLLENLSQFPPITVGNYYIYGSHLSGSLPQDKITIEINAATAFGSGEHETTSGCLEALDDLKKHGHSFDTFLDVGCGSGILALAMAKTWGKKVIGVDNDPECVRVSQENAQLNNCNELTHFFHSEGFSQVFKQSGIQQFDIITANILAQPLHDMAQDVVNHLNSGGFLILSGLLDNQANWVLEPYLRHGLHLFKKTTFKDWAVLILKK